MQEQTDTGLTSDECKGDNSESEKSDSFLSAFEEKYCCQSFEPQYAIIQFHSKVTTLHLKTVDLSRKEITHAGIPSDGLSSICPSIADLDISHNHFHQWSEILPLLYELPHLQYLNLTNNPIQLNQDYLNQLERPLEKLENLVLNRTNISLHDVLKLSRVMPALKELHICDNGYSELLGLEDHDLPNIQCLRMNNNKIKSWTEVWKLRHLPNLKSLILSGNPLQDVFYSEPCCSSNQSEKTPTCDKNFESSNLKKNSRNSNCEDSSENSNCDRPVKNDNDAPCESCDIQRSKVSDDVEDVCSNLVNEMLISASQQNGDASIHTRTNQKTQSYVDVTNDNTLHECRLDENQEMQNERGCKDFNEEDKSSSSPFQTLHTLCLTDTCLHNWKHLEALNQFPSLKSIRIKTKTLYPDVSEEEKRKLLIASLPNVEMFNGSEITSEEREDAERFYIRHYVDQRERPDRVRELQGVHGELSKIVDIHIGWKTPLFPRVHFYLNNQKVFTEKIDAKQTVQKLRKYLSKKLDVMQRVMTVYHLPCGPLHKHRMGEEIPEKEEMSCNYLPLSRFSIHDDDEIHVHELGTYP